MSKYDELVTKLKEVFQIDRPDLDFGVYRILNARAAEIGEYLDKRLKEKVAAALSSGSEATVQQIRQELADAEKQATSLGMDPASVPKVGELRKRIAELAGGNSDQENAVFSHLLTFFSRYYDSGDFISQRRYKGDTYAIPYAGEEVLLHWANKDQYYTKSGENFSNYTFKLEDGRKVHCRLVAADTAKDNRKDNDKERRYALIERKMVTRHADDGDDCEEELLPVEELVGEGGAELVLRFEYKAMPKGSKQDALTKRAVEAILASADVKARWLVLGQRVPTEKDPQRTLLEKHLVDYTTKNTADYFIHKDLGGFLRRELDFYIKNEVMHLDDVQHAERFSDIEKSLRMIQCLRAIALDLVSFLAQLENFQKKLWLKKKFVISASYCITLDRIPAELYREVSENGKQWDHWRKIGVCSESSPRTIDTLNSHPFLMVDTALFGPEFAGRVAASAGDLDDLVDGVLISGDNFQALNLIKERYRGKVSCIYIDPPYNTDASAISYKNGYKSSSWTSLMQGRLMASKELLDEKGVLVAAIDDAQQRELSFLMTETFGGNALGTICVRSNPSGRPMQSGYAVSHEYLIFAGKTASSVIGRLPPTPDQMARFNQQDERGPFEWRNLRREGSNSDRSARRALYYPIYINAGQIRVPAMDWDKVDETWIIKEKPFAGEQVVYPSNDDGVEKTWRWEWKTVMSSLEHLAVRKDRSGKDYVYYKRRPNEDGVVSVSSWFDAKYSATEHGTALLKNLFGTSPFSYPKSIHAVVDAVYIAGGADRNAVVLDYFAGSGTTGHAVIKMNRQDGGNRHYILVEQGEYFDSVTKPRLEKVVYCSEWDDGKPAAGSDGSSHAFKMIRIEGYEDALNNLSLRRSQAQGELLGSMTQETKDDYLLRYMLNVESRDSLLSVDSFRKPFDFSLKVSVDSAGASEVRKVDLVETFNYLIGLKVRHTELATERGYVRVEGTLPSGEEALILWRDCDKIDYEKLKQYTNRFDLNTREKTFDVVYINGDNNIPTVFTETAEEGGATRVLKLRQIEPEFLQRMFSVEDV